MAWPSSFLLLALLTTNHFHSLQPAASQPVHSPQTFFVQRICYTQRPTYQHLSCIGHRGD
jgi:hypothetical protein